MRPSHLLRIGIVMSLCALWHAAIVQPAAAQQDAAKTPATLLRRAAEGNWYVRAVTPEADTIQGRVRYSFSGPTIGGTSPPQIERIERRMEYGGGGTLGAIVGALMGAAFVGGVASGSENVGGSGVLVAAAGGASAGAVIGAFAGYAANPPNVRWELIWPDLR
jgi:hypothetical protein